MVSAMQLADLATPSLILDLQRMETNVSRLRSHLDSLGVGLRAHVKTCKSIEVARTMMASPRGPITVSTLREAEEFFAQGVTDILYAVGIAPGKLGAVQSLRARGCDLVVVVDHPEAARAVAQCRANIPVLIEIDCDGRRAGIKPNDSALMGIAATLAQGADLRGVMTHAGGSYLCRNPSEMRAMAEQERRAVTDAAASLRAAGFPTPIVSVGSTPTAHFATQLGGVTEVRAGVFVFMDLVMVGLGVCGLADVAISVLTTVIGHRQDRGWILTDGGWMALSRDRGTAHHEVDQGLGLVCDESGRPLPNLIVSDANQEHGILAHRDGTPIDYGAFPIGTRLRVLPNHACATAAQHDRYHCVRNSASVVGTWPRFGGW